MLDPFKMTYRMFIATFVVIGYSFVFVGQTIWYLIFKRPDRIGDAMGQTGRGFVDVVADIFRER